MSTKSKWHGHTIEFSDGEWYYEDGVKVKLDKSRKCGHCNKENTVEGHDGCLGTLIGVMNACCGHGVETEAYVQFLDRKLITGKDAVVVLEILKRNSKL